MELVKIWDPWRDFVPFVQSKKRENTHGGTSTCNFTKSNSLPWVFFTFFKFHEWYHIARSITSNQDSFVSISHYLRVCMQTTESSKYEFFKYSLIQKMFLNLIKLKELVYISQISWGSCLEMLFNFFCK